MGEEEKMVEEQQAEEKKVEEKPKKVEEAGEKKLEEEKDKSDTTKVEQISKEPPPPQEIVLRVYMHCDGCARKVRKCLQGFGEVMTDCKTHKVVVKGDKADPLKVLARLQRKTHARVELLSPIPPPPAEPEITQENEIPQPPQEVQPQVITAVLKVHMHCEACAQEIKKRIQRIQGVEFADPDLNDSQVTVKGVFDPLNLVKYVYKKTGKHATVIKQEAEKKKEQVEGDEVTEEGKDGEGGDQEGKSAEELPAPEDDGKEKEGGEDKEAEEVAAAAAAAAGDDEEKKTEVMELLKKNELYYYFPQQDYQINPLRVAYPYLPAPQMFSDENPNACSVM